MKIAVLGATGGLGRHVVRAALAGGHTVHALVRDGSKLEPQQGVVVVQGDLSDAAAVRAALAGTEAVVSCVGVVKGGDPEVFRAGMQHVVSAMGELGVRRLVAISGAGLQLEGDASGLGRRVIITLLKLFARDVLRGKELEWEVIRESAVDWTLVRVARMVEGPAKGGVKCDLSKVGGSPMVAYADVAGWMVAAIARPTWVRAAPFVSGM